MKLLILLLFSTSIQSQVVIRDTFPIKSDFARDAHKGVQSYIDKNNNSFYRNNVSKTPLFESADTIIYRLKFITQYSGMLLWEGIGTIVKDGNNLIVEVSKLKMLKKSAMLSTVDYINVAVDDMEPTRGNNFNLSRIRKEVDKFMKFFKRG